MAITPLPSPPLPSDTTAEYNTKAFAWVAALDTFTTETNAVASDVSDDADAAAQSVIDATAQVTLAEAEEIQGGGTSASWLGKSRIWTDSGTVSSRRMKP